jgi:hypothetical protein
MGIDGGFAFFGLTVHSLQATQIRFCSRRQPQIRSTKHETNIKYQDWKF